MGETESGQQILTPLMSPKMAALYLGISNRTLARLVQHGVVAVVRLGGSRRFKLEDLQAATERNRSGGDV
jgi:excisionase family DNA binding protein